ncbi:biopolymer transporter ExbB [Paracoccus sp. S-4012]|nr:biopolymer transporter ExbB [Paracoccus sp. S-4012]
MRQIVLMLVVLALVVAGGVLAYSQIYSIFHANLWLNGTILAVFVLGVLACFWQAAQLVGSVAWIERFAARREQALKAGVAPRAEGDTDEAPRLLAPLAALLGSAGPSGGFISTSSGQSILDSVATRVGEAREITRYLAQLLIFLGLLGTFYGLATTIPGVVETIRGLAPEPGQTAADMFGRLMGGLEGQLAGMATAFSSSLLGLAGSLVVGLLELFVIHGQNRFYRELEEWMSGFTRVGIGGAEGDAAGLDHAALAGFLDQMALHLQALTEFYARRDEVQEQHQMEADERALVMARSVERMTEQARADAGEGAEQAARLADVLERLAAQGGPDPGAAVQGARLAEAVQRLAQGQERLIQVAASARDEAADRDDGTEARMRLRSIDLALARMAEETSSGRADMMVELRADIAQLTRAVRALGGTAGH